MGGWDNTPWGNDSAADWFVDLFRETNFREKVKECLEMDATINFEEIRAAAYILIVLGRNYIWSGVKELDDDLTLAIKKMKEIHQRQFGYHDDELEIEISILENRLKRKPDSLALNLCSFKKLNELTLVKNKLDNLPNFLKKILKEDWVSLLQKPGVKEILETIVLGKKSRRSLKICNTWNEKVESDKDNSIIELLLIDSPFIVHVQKGTSKKETLDFLKSVIFELENSEKLISDAD